MNIADNIKKLRKSHGYTQKDLANILQVKPTAISAWESGRNKPLMDKVTIMATLFGVSTSDIVGDTFNKNNSILSLINEVSSQLTPPRQQKVYDFAKHELEEQQESEQKNKVQSLQKYRELNKHKKEFADIEWYGCASAGTGEFMFDNKEVISLPKKQIPIEADFCLTVNGDSMEPLIHDQDYIFVSKQDTLFNGNIGVVIIDGEAFIKKVFFEDDKARLQSFNKKYKDIIVDDSNDFKIIGKVVL
ncbi:helix-turn-helix transcriptional regulator [Enterococcus faecium]|uniref:helix-turn-helix domain-containing protein n=1 Tax=Enterococcus TaxID=1350 RepID=UPI0015741638|nr:MULTISPECIES: XRE family transcriptional regulator [Enterococcus]EGP4927262.1 helix-turn-helix transcriptional regulator [Enterococcus faecium]EGP5054836.1 helix-turn-helix transcriptional regulator [Enterococcus faecium]EGP5143237.1 XRE family transcriptional regulator [Enterococcus faecium]EME3484121.1 helix-turn-helix transcriptional regulator [Enterococcus faecium]EME5381417.1 helix-turn-helix transcriptional regulator [Enterococcus faecium]